MKISVWGGGGGPRPEKWFKENVCPNVVYIINIYVQISCRLYFNVNHRVYYPTFSNACFVKQCRYEFVVILFRHSYTYNLQFYISQFIVQARETFDSLYYVLVLDPTSATASGGMNLPR